MILKILFIQRREKYPGQFAPEAVEVMDENSYDENPDYLAECLEKLVKQPDVVAARIVAINIGSAGQKAVRDALVSTPEVIGSVMTPSEGK